MTFARIALRGIYLVMVALLAASIVAAGVPPALDEDRSQPGFCSPDCPLQQDATHSIAVAAAPPARNLPEEPTREWLETVPTPACLAAPVPPDAPRAPPQV